MRPVFKMQSHRRTKKKFNLFLKFLKVKSLQYKIYYNFFSTHERFSHNFEPKLAKILKKIIISKFLLDVMVISKGGLGKRKKSINLKW